MTANEAASWPVANLQEEHEQSPDDRGNDVDGTEKVNEACLQWHWARSAMVDMACLPTLRSN
jgi:hypothetical protein